MKYAYITAQRDHHPIGFMCRMLEVSCSGFFAWQARERAPRSDADAPLREAIAQVHEESRRRYGRRRLTHALRAQGMCVNPKRVRRVMREEGLRGVRKGRFVPRTTDSAHQRVVAPNVLQMLAAVRTPLISGGLKTVMPRAGAVRDGERRFLDSPGSSLRDVILGAVAFALDDAGIGVMQ